MAKKTSALKAAIDPSDIMQRFVWFLTGLLLCLNNLCFADKSPYEWAQIKLDFVRDDKYEQLDRLCQALHTKAAAVGQDAIMLDFFVTSLNVKDAGRETSQDPDLLRLRQTLENQHEQLQKLVQSHYLKDYISFRDILFVDMSGDVIYTFRKGTDDGTNLFTGTAKDSPLTKGLRQAKTQEVFVDFFVYPAADEPVALFIEPAVRKGKQLGWFVLEITLNKFNSLFTGHEQLTSTGETFLANRQGYLLTESGFVGDATILKMKLDNRNVEPKFAAERGNKRVIDYRGFEVLTSFAVYQMMGTEWLIVAKVDESEVLTRYFLEHFEYFYGRLAAKLSPGSRHEGQLKLADPERHRVMVDMDEFVKAEPQAWLETVGVSTCTALVAAFPGRFGYLAHISPYDQMYGQNGTNLLGNLFKKIMHYDVYPFERRQIQLTVVANHLKSLPAILHKLTGEGLLLSQISVLYNPKAHSANVTYDPKGNWLSVEWLSANESGISTVCIPQAENNLETVFKEIMESPDRSD